MRDAYFLEFECLMQVTVNRCFTGIANIRTLFFKLTHLFDLIFEEIVIFDWSTSGTSDWIADCMLGRIFLLSWCLFALIAVKRRPISCLTASSDIAKLGERTFIGIREELRRHKNCAFLEYCFMSFFLTMNLIPLLRYLFVFCCERQVLLKSKIRLWARLNDSLWLQLKSQVPWRNALLILRFIRLNCKTSVLVWGITFLVIAYQSRTFLTSKSRGLLSSHFLMWLFTILILLRKREFARWCGYLNTLLWVDFGTRGLKLFFFGLFLDNRESF